MDDDNEDNFETELVTHPIHFDSCIHIVVHKQIVQLSVP